jgi:hypothetical protein
MSKPEECQSCHYTTEALELYSNTFETPGVLKDLWLCELCAGSLAGNAARYFRIYDDDLRMITGCIMNAANRILAEIRKVNNG